MLFVLGLLQVLLLAMVIRLQRPSIATGPPGRLILQPESIDPDAYRRELTYKKDALLLGDYSPSKSPVRAGAIAVMFVLIFLPPIYLVVRWFAAEGLPEGVPGNAIVFTFFGAAAVVALFLHWWKSNSLVARAFQKEIDALEWPLLYRTGDSQIRTKIFVNRNS